MFDIMVRDEAREFRNEKGQLSHDLARLVPVSGYISVVSRR